LDTLIGWLIIGFTIYFFMNRSAKKKIAHQKKIAEQKNSRQASSSRTTFKTSVSSTRASNYKPKPTYKAPMFAQPGEKGDLFGYGSYTDRHSIDATYSLIDFETSGFQPGNAKILEVAVIKIDSKGKIIGEFNTLVNPENGFVGPTDVHRITPSMVSDAPTLSEIMGDLIAILDSSIIVAHNARFEENFLDFALRENGIKHPLMPSIDTLWLSRQVLDLPNYKLGTVIQNFDIEFKDAHTAYGDVRAMATVFPEMLAMSKEIKFPTTLQKSPIVKSTGKMKPRLS
jgi:DNA polymerase III epsilon subunit-like protein